MIEGIPWDAVGTGGATTLLAFTVWLILSGRLIPKATYDMTVKLLNQEKAAIARSLDHWQATAMAKTEIIKTLSETVHDQTIVSEVTAKVMGSIQDAAKSEDGS